MPEFEPWQTLLHRLAPDIARDPRVPAVLRLGAIGHREIGVAVREPISRTIAEILTLIRQSAEIAQTDSRVREQFREGLDLVVVSPLAEGADRMIAEIGLTQGYRLGAILPFTPIEYEKTFDLADSTLAISQFRTLLSKAELPIGYGVFVIDGDHATDLQRNESFIYCAKSVTRWADIVIAVLSQQREESQTAISVREAIDMGLPVIVIDPDYPRNFRFYIEHELSNEKDTETGMRMTVLSLLAPSRRPGPQMRHATGQRSSSLAAYRVENIEYDPSLPCDFEYLGPYRARTIAPFWVRLFCDLNQTIEHGVKLLLGTLPKHAAHVSLLEMPFDKAMAAPIVSLFLRYHRADVVANAYAELYRSTQIVIVALGIATVVFAGINVTTSFWPPLFAGLELLSFSFALSFVWVAHRQSWLERWLDCRLVAEIFRYSKFLMLTGRASPFMELRKPCMDEDGDRAWTRDYSQHVLRAHCLGVPGRGLELKENAIHDIKRYVVSQCLNDQIHYHEDTAARREKLARLLRALSVILSFGTIFVIAIRFALKLASSLHIETFDVPGSAVEMTAVILPAITAAIFALRAYGEHEVIARRCTTMVADLHDERRSVEQARNFEALGEKMLGVVRVLLWDVDGWLDLFADKYLE